MEHAGIMVCGGNPPAPPAGILEDKSSGVSKEPVETWYFSMLLYLIIRVERSLCLINVIIFLRPSAEFLLCLTFSLLLLAISLLFQRFLVFHKHFTCQATGSCLSSQTFLFQDGQQLNLQAGVFLIWKANMISWYQSYKSVTWIFFCIIKKKKITAVTRNRRAFLLADTQNCSFICNFNFV